MALNDLNVTVLCGGVGGAKLAYGLAQIIPPEKLRIIVNTGDDFWHYGLRICPDVDTVLYTLANIANPRTGWGLEHETYNVLDALKTRYNLDTWFRLGDADIATHIFRTQRLQEGFSLLEVIEEQARHLKIGPTILPMCNEEVPTKINCLEEGELDFQTYFVRLKHEPVVRSLRNANSENAFLTPQVRHALEVADIILIAPSNPWLSIAPILSVPELKKTIMSLDIPKIAVSPIVNGKAIKGPAAQLMKQLGVPVNASGVAHFYVDLINGFVFDLLDRNEMKQFYTNGTMNLTALDTMMVNSQAKIRLAREILSWMISWH